MCLDPNVVYNRMKMREDGEKSGTSISPDKKDNIQNQTGGGFSSLFGFAKNSLQKTLNFG